MTASSVEHEESGNGAGAVEVRLARPADAAVLARHRVQMFGDMGQLDAALQAPLGRLSEHYFMRAMPAGEYVAWLAVSRADPTEIVGGAGVQVRPILPRPDHAGHRLLVGRQGLVVNVYTEPSWRRRGVAHLLMRRVLEWARAEGLASIVLHASGEGRPLYERLDFAATNEMQYMGGLGEAERAEGEQPGAERTGANRQGDG